MKRERAPKHTVINGLCTYPVDGVLGKTNVCVRCGLSANVLVSQSVLLDVAHFVPQRSIVLPLFLGLQQSSSSHRCSSLLTTPPLTLSPCPPAMSTRIRLTHTTQSHAHTPALVTAQYRPKRDGKKERGRGKLKERGEGGVHRGMRSSLSARDLCLF